MTACKTYLYKENLNLVEDPPYQPVQITQENLGDHEYTLGKTSVKGAHQV